MAVKGFNVLALFATIDVTVNSPTFKKRLSGKVMSRDRKISSIMVHIERLIGFWGKHPKFCAIL